MDMRLHLDLYYLVRAHEATLKPYNAHISSLLI